MKHKKHEEKHEHKKAAAPKSKKMGMPVKIAKHSGRGK
jgi:hypothetical protein